MKNEKVDPLSHFSFMDTPVDDLSETPTFSFHILHFSFLIHKKALLFTAGQAHTIVVSEVSALRYSKQKVSF
jgi:hypothetical protein